MCCSVPQIRIHTSSSTQKTGQETWSTDDNSRPPNSWQPGRKLKKARFGNQTSSKLELYKVTKIFEDSEPLTFPYLLPKNHKTSLPFLSENLQNLVVKFKLPQVATVILTCQSNFLSLEFFSWKWTCIYLYKAIVGPNPFNFFRIPPKNLPPKKNWEPPSVNKMCLSGHKSAKRLTGKSSAFQRLDP